MAFNRTFAPGSRSSADHILQLIKALEGDSGQGQAVSLIALDSGTAYALDVRNLGAGGALRVRDTTGNITLTFADAALTYALGTITTDAGLRVTGTLNAAGVAFVPVDVNITRTAAAAGARLLRVRQDGNAILEVVAVASAGTGIAVTPAAAGSGVGVAAISTGTNEPLKLDAKGSGMIVLATTSTGQVVINDSGTANAKMTMGLTINQGAADDEILALKSSDVAHGITDVAETDTYGLAQKGSATGGGMLLRGLSEGNGAFFVTGTETTNDTAKTTAAGGAILLNSELKSGTGVASMGVDANMVAVRNNGATRFILDADGDSHQDVGTAWTNFDDHDDAALLNSLAMHVARTDDPIRADFRQWATESRERLQVLEVVAFNPDGHHFVNMSKLTMLLVGAVRQQYARLIALERRLLPA